MRKFIYFASIAILLVACRDAYYMEGRVRTDEPTAITASSARLSGSLIISRSGRDTEPIILSRGFVLRADGRPDIIVSDAIDRTGSFSLTASLRDNTTYTVQAFAAIRYNFDQVRGGTSSSPAHVYLSRIDTFYGNVIEFRTLAGTGMPLIITQDPSSITATSARLNATIIYEGSPPYTERGFVHSTTQNPTIGNATRRRVPGTGEGAFFADITGLVSNTIHFVRAYAIRGVDTIYGEQIHFISTSPLYVVLEGAGIAVPRADVSTAGVNRVSAINLCEGLDLGGHTDWRLPTLTELGTLYINRTLIGGFITTNSRYWSNVQGSANNMIDFRDGSIVNGNPDATSTNISTAVTTLPLQIHRARCVRTLP